jgi:hypothetical protein
MSLAARLPAGDLVFDGRRPIVSMTPRSTPLARMLASAFMIRGSSRGLIAMTSPVDGSAREGIVSALFHA